MVVIAVPTTAVALAGVAAPFLPDRSGIEDLIDSPSSTARRLGLRLVALVLPAVLWPRRPRPASRGGSPGRGSSAEAWSRSCERSGGMRGRVALVAVAAVVVVGPAGRDARAGSELAALPERIGAVPGVTGAGGARLVDTDLANGTTCTSPRTSTRPSPREERLRALNELRCPHRSRRG